MTFYILSVGSYQDSKPWNPDQSNSPNPGFDRNSINIITRQPLLLNKPLTEQLITVQTNRHTQPLPTLTPHWQTPTRHSSNSRQAGDERFFARSGMWQSNESTERDRRQTTGHTSRVIGRAIKRAPNKPSHRRVATLFMTTAAHARRQISHDGWAAFLNLQAKAACSCVHVSQKDEMMMWGTPYRRIFLVPKFLQVPSVRSFNPVPTCLIAFIYSRPS